MLIKTKRNNPFEGRTERQKRSFNFHLQNYHLFQSTFFFLCVLRFQFPSLWNKNTYTDVVRSLFCRPLLCSLGRVCSLTPFIKFYDKWWNLWINDADIETCTMYMLWTEQYAVGMLRLNDVGQGQIQCCYISADKGHTLAPYLGLSRFLCLVPYPPLPTVCAYF